MALWSILAYLLCVLAQQGTHASAIARRQDTSATHNNFECRSAVHPNPVIVLHGIGCNAYSCINGLYDFLGESGFCTFSTTYGAALGGGLPVDVGGITSISRSSAEVAAFVQQVITLTGALRVDFVGHSEGGLMVLYVPKFYPDLLPFIDQVFSIAPPTHGTTLGGLYDLAYVAGDTSRELIGEIFETVDCGACNDLGPDGPAVVALNTGPIAQAGLRYTILATTHDEIVTPPDTAFVNEPGVQNFYIQDFCPEDGVGHAGLPYNENVQRMVANVLGGGLVGPGYCSSGPNLAAALNGAVEALSGSSDLTPLQGINQGVNDIVGNLQIVRH